MSLGDIWKLLAGLGIFLYGMQLLEETTRKLAGRTFKLLLRKYTSNSFGGVLSGLIITGLLQSSSVVNFMVLAFLGAGILEMSNALGIVLGANVGSTVAGWIVTQFGFKFNLEDFTFPIIAMAALAMMAFPRRETVQRIAFLLLGFSFLFLGLSFMKTGMDAVLKDFDFRPYLGYSLWFFGLVGFVLTAIVQSSSATMIITLSALNTGLIPFPVAVAVVIGSEPGTSIKTMFGALKGVADKKRVAAANIFFNIVTSLAALIFIHQLIYLVNELLAIKDPLYALVAFQTLINILAAILFAPFLKPMAAFLSTRFRNGDESLVQYLSGAAGKVPETALTMMEKESRSFIRRVIALNLEAFHIAPHDLQLDFNEGLHRHKPISYDERYEFIKKGEGEILHYFIRMSEKDLGARNFERWNQLMTSIRNAMYSAKGLKDILHNRQDFRNSADDVKYDYYHLFKKDLKAFYQELLSIIDGAPQSPESLVHLFRSMQDQYQERSRKIYNEAAQKVLNETDISSLLNVNRELYSSCKAITLATRDLLYSGSEAEEFDRMPLSS